MLAAFMNSRPFLASAADSLMQFLLYYGRDFYNECTIIMSEGYLEVVDPTAMRALTSAPELSQALVVTAPWRPEFNVTVNVTRFPEIRSTFFHAYSSLKQAKAMFILNPEQEILSAMFNLPKHT